MICLNEQSYEKLLDTNYPQPIALTDRKQCIVDGNVRSSTQCSRRGVPEGSVLGPVLFLLFVNDIPLFVTEADLYLYADNATMHTSCKKIYNCRK